MAFLYGFLLSLIISVTAYYKKSLTLLGMLTAVVVGTLIYGFGSYITFTLLMVFFISSSLLTKLKEHKTSNGRGAIQVLANSLATLLFSIAYHVTTNMGFLVVAAVSVAATTADTWASEIGKMSKGKTFSILTFKPIEKGTSGGVSTLGLFASVMGSMVIAGVFLLLISIQHGYEHTFLMYALIIIGAGLLGSIIDSYLGIFIQAKYLDKTGCVIETFIRDQGLKLISGVRYINNDMVNLLMTLITTFMFTFILIV